MVGLDWNHCLEYEFQLRNRLIRDQGVSIQQALWAGYADPQHRMKHWITYLSKEVVALRSQRSRSPRGERAQKQPLP